VTSHAARAFTNGRAMSFAGALMLSGMFFPGVGIANAKTVDVSLTAKEVQLPIDNKGTMYARWTYNGEVPGPVIRVTEGDTVHFTLHNAPGNKNSHSIDLHAAQVDVMTQFAPIKPGESKTWDFTAKYPGVFFYHCGSDPMIQHVARGMFGTIIVDPKDPNAMPKADREYVLIQSELYKNPEDVKAMMADQWSNVMFNGVAFKYDPLHDPNATETLQAKPGERVRIYFVNAGPNEFSAFHPIAGIWDAVYPSGNPKNVLHGMQNYTVGPGDAAIFDLISPVEGANAIVSHSLRSALSGAIAVIMFSKDADPKMGHGEEILVR
jgi:nitrite reductase (NO-forming)